MMCSVEAHHVAEEVLAATQDPSQVLLERDAKTLEDAADLWWEKGRPVDVVAFFYELAAKIRNGETDAT